MGLSPWLRFSADRAPLPLPSLSIRLTLFLASLAQVSRAITFNPVPPADLDISQLGRVGLVGDFDGISLYQYEGQNQDGFSTNGSQSILTPFPNGGFASLAAADAGIQAMCSFIMEGGTMAGVVVGGNFTSLEGTESQGVGLFNPDTSVLTPLTGLSGQVSALLCDQDTNTVYVGGSFKAENSTNAIAWVGTTGWTNLPFAGFNGPVKSITKASNGNIVFGGSFTALGNNTIGPRLPDQQIINIAGAELNATSSTTTTGFSDPANIVCNSPGVDGPGNTWLLADDATGSWKASFGYGFHPTKLRLWNTHLDGRGTKTWRYTAFPINGIMNFTYIDPDTGHNASCSSECPLSSSSTVPYQDFNFVNVIGMNGFQIDISAFYGSGGGLNGVELFQNDISAYAIPSFNEPTCADIPIPSNATSTGPWVVSPSQQSSSEYLTATFTSSSSANVVFMPNIQQSGNYSVDIYTPGCIQDGTCSSRGQINVTGIMSSDTDGTSFQTQIFQTNNFDKYDQIYFGYVEAGTTSFRPTVTLSAADGQNTQGLTIVAQRVGFKLISSDGGLNSLFEYDPELGVMESADLANSTFNAAGMSLPTGAGVNALQTSGSTTYVGGNFTNTEFNNILAITDSGATSLAESGLDGEVLAMFLNGTTLYVGGKFTKSISGGATAGLSNVAMYDTSKNSWIALGAGVDGTVTSIVPLALNVTANTPELVITLTGEFKQIFAFGTNSSVAVTGFAVWVPSRGNWLQNLGFATPPINGQLTASVDLPTGGSLLAGSLSSAQLGAKDAVALTDTLNTLPVAIRQTQSEAPSNLGKRATATHNVTGVVTGLFDEANGRNLTILGGHFAATASNGSVINNILFIDNSNSNVVTGVGPSLSNDSTILAMVLQGDTLYAGGSISGTVNGRGVTGMVAFDLSTSSFGTQPPSLAGDVNAISVRQGTGDVYAAGSFSAAGSLECPAVCVFATTASQWDRPGTNLGGTAHAMTWASSTSLVVGGALTVDGESVSLAKYDTKSQSWTAASGANAIPGPVAALTAANSDASQLWVAGTAANGSAFLMKFDGTNWNSVGDVFGSGTTIRSLKVLPLSKNHETSYLVPDSQELLITGALNLQGFGNASSVLFNGTAFQPFALTSSASNAGSSISQIFSSRQNFFEKAGGKLAKGFVVLIALGIALGLIFLLVVAGIIIERIRRKYDGYVPAPSASFDRSQGLSRVPPEQLFGSLAQGRSGVEKQSLRI
ncbi:uncharacterized protein L3040_006457 [Drepanopeziza brunnea f. sp. 'multigermtubi']|uniref:uncharacterized protein n=1 Tax=Drepanopeziza brunnea f. sp. 'multigermtubi' TaxID=698441 RepID=UPI0023832E13|nr:hypothetical protein L3040_006457 [Drepanopeziza brunnea f. sp. 'multigermtubi']